MLDPLWSLTIQLIHSQKNYPVLCLNVCALRQKQLRHRNVAVVGRLVQGGLLALLLFARGARAHSLVGRSTVVTFAKGGNEKM